MKKILSFFLLTIFSVAFSQGPAIQWQKRFGGSKDEIARAIRQTRDGGYVVAGCTASFTNDGDVALNHSSFSFPNDIWVLKLDSCGALQWQRSLGGSSDDFANAVIQTRDGGYIVAGFTQSTDGDITSTHGGGSDAWVVKLDSSGNLSWQKTLGGYNNDGITNIIETHDKGYMAIAWSSSNADTLGDDDYDYAFYKLDSMGVLQWQKLYGGTSDDTPFDVIQTTDGKYIATGYATSTDGNVIGHNGPTGQFDCWMVTVDSSGNLLRSQCLGGSGDDRGRALLQNSGSSFVVLATTNSTDGNVASSHGGYDVWLFAQDTSGNILWQKSFGGSLDETAHSLQASGANGFLLSADSYSNDGDVMANHAGSEDIWLLNLDASGSVNWKKNLGGTQHDEPAMFLQTQEGGYVVGGTTASTDGDVSGIVKGLSDYWIVKMSPYLPVSGTQTICAGDSVTLAVTGAGSYTWMPGGSTGQTVRVAPSSSTTYTVYASMNACTPVFNTVYVKVNPVPVVTFTTLGFRDSICYSSGAHALTGATPAGGTYSGPGVSGPDFDPALSGIGSFILSYSYTNSNGCTAIASHSVTVIASPTVSFTSLGFPDSICVDAGIQTLSGGAPAGGIYTGIGVSGASYNPAAVGSGVHAVYYNYTNSANCTSTASHTLMVNALPVITFTSLGFPDNVCLNAGIQTLSGATPGGGTYSGAGVNGNNFDPLVADTGVHTISYSYTNSGHCTSSSSHTVMVLVAPVATFPSLGFPDSVCQNAGAQSLSDGMPGGGSYFGPGVNGSSFNPSSVSVGTYTLNYVYTNGNNCSDTASHGVKVNAVPVATFTSLGFADSVCYDGGVQTLSGGAPAGGVYSGPGVTGSSFDPTQVGAGTYTLSYIYADGSNCTDTATHSVTVKICNTTSVAGSAPSSVSIFPNPAHNTCFIRAQGSLGNIVLLNLLGEQLLQLTTNKMQAEIDLSFLQSGVYIIRTQQGYSKFTKE